MMAVAFDAKGDAQQPYLEDSTTLQNPESNAEHVLAKALDLKRPSTGEGPCFDQFFLEIVHLYSLLHALALQHLRCDPDLSNIGPSVGWAPVQRESALKLTEASNLLNGLPGARCLRLSVVGGLLPEECVALSTDSKGTVISSAARVAMSQSWVLRRLMARQQHEPAGDMGKTAPPILSRMVQLISDGHLEFSQAAKVAEAQFPFPYKNLISIFLWLFVMTFPFVINAKFFNVPGRFVINFLTVWAYFSSHQ